MSRIEEQVIESIRKRAEGGEKKYGVTMERKDLGVLQWLQHLQEELLDGVIYIERLKEEEIKKSKQFHFLDQFSDTQIFCSRCKTVYNIAGLNVELLKQEECKG